MVNRRWSLFNFFSGEAVDAVAASDLKKNAPSLMLAILMVATGCRIYQLDAFSLWADELWGIHACSLGSWWAMVESMIHNDSHPPGYQTLLYVWIYLFGDKDITVRLISAIAGIAAVHALYHFALRFLTPMIALIAAALLAVSYNAIYYSQEARAYAFILLFAIWHFHLFFLLFVENQKTVWHWLAFWIVGTGLCYFHYVGVVIVASEGLAMLLTPAFRQQFRVFFKAFVPIVILFSPWFLNMLRQLSAPDDSWKTPAPDWDVLINTARFIWGPASLLFYPAVSSFIAYLFFVGMAIRAGNLSLIDRRLMQLIVLAFVPWLLFFIKSHVSASAYTIRHFIFLIPVALLVMARILERCVLWVKPDIGTKGLSVFLVILLGLMVMLNISDNIKVGGKLYAGITKIEYREAVKLIKSDTAFKNQKIRSVFVSNSLFKHYLLQEGFDYNPGHHIDQLVVEKLPQYQRMIRKHLLRDFYYIEIFQNIEDRKPSPVLRGFQERYYAVCSTRFVWLEVFKFNTQLPPNPSERPKHCPRDFVVTAELSEPVVTLPVVTSPVVTSPVVTLPVSAPPAESAPPALPVGQ